MQTASHIQPVQICVTTLRATLLNLYSWCYEQYLTSLRLQQKPSNRLIRSFIYSDSVIDLNYSFEESWMNGFIQHPEFSLWHEACRW